MLVRSYPTFEGRLLSGVAALVFAAATALTMPQPAQAATTLVVDDDGKATAANCDAGRPAHPKIQDAVNEAVPGTTILVCPGTYAEQVVLSTSNVTIRGAGQGVTVLRPSAVPATVTSPLGPFSIAPILLVQNAIDVTVTQLTIDGAAADSGASTLICPQVGFYAGLLYRNASGTVDATQVTKVNSATRCSSGIRSEAGGGGVSNLIVKNSLVDQNGNFGVVCAGLASTCTVTGTSVKGRGLVADQIQAGIVIRGGATATITGNAIRDHAYALKQGVPTFSVGIFLVNADPSVNPHLLQQNTFSNNDLDVQRVSSAGAL